MILQRLPGNFNQEYTLTKKVRNEVRLSEIDRSDLKNNDISHLNKVVVKKNYSQVFILKQLSFH